MEFFYLWILASVAFLIHAAYYHRKEILGALKTNFKYLTWTAGITVVAYFAFWYTESKDAAINAGMVVLFGAALIWAIGAGIWCLWFSIMLLEWGLRILCYPFHTMRVGDDTPRTFNEYVFEGKSETIEAEQRRIEAWNSLSYEEQQEIIADSEREQANRLAAEENRKAEKKQRKLMAAYARESSTPQFSSKPVTTQRQPAKVAPKATFNKPQESNKYFVERLAPGGYKYQKLTGGDSNIRNAQRRMEQHQDARYGIDRNSNASDAKYRIVDKDGKVQ